MLWKAQCKHTRHIRGDWFPFKSSSLSQWLVSFYYVVLPVCLKSLCWPLELLRLTFAWIKCSSHNPYWFNSFFTGMETRVKWFRASKFGFCHLLAPECITSPALNSSAFQHLMNATLVETQRGLFRPGCSVLYVTARCGTAPTPSLSWFVIRWDPGALKKQQHLSGLLMGNLSSGLQDFGSSPQRIKISSFKSETHFSPFFYIKPS